jgi:hypothetical protein
MQDGSAESLHNGCQYVSVFRDGVLRPAVETGLKPLLDCPADGVSGRRLNTGGDVLAEARSLSRALVLVMARTVRRLRLPSGE